MNRRDLVTKAASRLRVLSLFERLGSRPALAVLVYHRILRPENWPYDRDVIEATPEQFDEQMAMLKRRHDVAGPEEMVELILEPKKLKRLRVAITFDDGYLDNYENAFPILKSHGLQASFFIPTDFVGTKLLPWWDRIAFAVRNTTRSELKLTYPKAVTIPVDRNDLATTIRSVLRAFKREENVVLDTFLANLEEASGITLPVEAPDRQFLSWDEAKEMQRGGMAIGSHTHSHRILGHLSPEDQRAECEDSRALLKKNDLGADTLAYPVGNPLSFSRVTEACVQGAGYRTAFSNYGGLNLPNQMSVFDVKRIGMDLSESATHLRARLALSSVARRQIW
jgi:peptidoglycan/xylan/chitin deacetylase (PgdA/CDA1 family)